MVRSITEKCNLWAKQWRRNSSQEEPESQGAWTQYFELNKRARERERERAEPAEDEESKAVCRLKMFCLLSQEGMFAHARVKQTHTKFKSAHGCRVSLSLSVLGPSESQSQKQQRCIGEVPCDTAKSKWSRASSHAVPSPLGFKDPLRSENRASDTRWLEKLQKLHPIFEPRKKSPKILRPIDKE